MSQVSLTCTISIELARRSGMKPLTQPSLLPRERALLDRVIADMERGGINYALVSETGSTANDGIFEGVAVWRGHQSIKI